MPRTIRFWLWIIPIVATAMALLESLPASAAEGTGRPNLLYSERPLVRSVTEVSVRSVHSRLDPEPGAISAEKGVTPAHITRRVPSDPDVDPAAISPSGPETWPGSGIPLADDGDLVLYADERLSDTDTGNPGSWPREPTAATFGRTALYTGNTFGAISDDAGDTWQYLEPNATLGIDTADGDLSVCCDQIVVYEPRRGAMIWLLQSEIAGGENVYYLAYFVGQENIASVDGYAYTLDPQEFGFASGVWWDFPSLTVSNNYVWFTTDGVGDGDAVMVRAELDDFLDGTPTTFEYAKLNSWALRLIQSSDTGVMYAAGHVDNNTIKIYRWPESGTITAVNRDVDAWNNGTNSVTLPDGSPWLNAANTPPEHGHSITGAVASANHIYFMWTASQGGGYAYPQVQIAQFTRDDSRDYVQTQVVYNSEFAWAFPSAAANAREHLAGTIAFGGPSYYPSSAVWIADDYNLVDLEPLENKVVESGDHSYTSSGRWGDYFSTRRHVPYGGTWIGSGFTVEQGNTSSSDVTSYTWFGRERDRPPSTNTILVDGANSTGWESGTADHPFNTIREGGFATMPGDVVRVQSGTYDEQPRLDRQCTIRAEGGVVTIR